MKERERPIEWLRELVWELVNRWWDDRHTVWPDWGIFEISLWKFFLKRSPNIWWLFALKGEKIKVKTALANFGATFWQFWATFLFLHPGHTGCKQVIIIITITRRRRLVDIFVAVNYRFRNFVAVVVVVVVAFERVFAYSIIKSTVVSRELKKNSNKFSFWISPFSRDISYRCLPQ